MKSRSLEDATRGTLTFAQWKERTDTYLRESRAAAQQSGSRPAAARDPTDEQLDHELLDSLTTICGSESAARAALAPRGGYVQPVRGISALQESDAGAELGERAGSKRKPTPTGPRTVELREPADPTKTMREAFTAMGYSETEAQSMAEGRG